MECETQCPRALRGPYADDQEEGANGCSVKPIDLSLCKLLKPLLQGGLDRAKRERGVAEYQRLRPALENPSTAWAMDTVLRQLSGFVQELPTSADEAAAILHGICAGGLSGVAALLFAKWPELLSQTKPEDVLPICPNSGALKLWIKKAGIPAKELQARLLADQSGAYLTVGADWLLEKVPASKLVVLLELLLSRRPRPAHLPTWSEVFATLLEKDKKGATLRFILMREESGADHLESLAFVLRESRTLLRAAATQIPNVLGQKGDCPNALTLVEKLYETIAETEGAQREFTTATLAHLGSALLLLAPRSPTGREILALAGRIGTTMRARTQTPELQELTWLLGNLRGEEVPGEGRQKVTTEGARHLALAFEQAAAGLPATDILYATAKNLGLTPIGAAGATVTYVPKLHEDTLGGLLPGSDVQVEAVGWSIGGQVIMRAKVHRVKGD